MHALCAVNPIWYIRKYKLDITEHLCYNIVCPPNRCRSPPSAALRCRTRTGASCLISGTGQSLNGIKDGLRRAVAHGFLVQEVEPRWDRGSRVHLFCLRMSNPDTLSVRI
jgi:hypothetical protein